MNGICIHAEAYGPAPHAVRRAPADVGWWWEDGVGIKWRSFASCSLCIAVSRRPTSSIHTHTPPTSTRMTAETRPLAASPPGATRKRKSEEGEPEPPATPPSLTPRIRLSVPGQRRPSPPSTAGGGVRRLRVSPVAPRSATSTAAAAAAVTRDALLLDEEEEENGFRASASRTPSDLATTTQTPTETTTTTTTTGDPTQTQGPDPVATGAHALADPFSRHFQWDVAALPLKADHADRPVWVADTGRVLVECHGPLAGPAQDFLTTVAEPRCRTAHIHEYQLTQHSLYAAAAIGLTSRDLVRALTRLCKTALPPGIRSYVEHHTARCGKVKLVLRHRRYFLESRHADLLQRLVKDPVIRAAVDAVHGFDVVGSRTVSPGGDATVAQQQTVPAAAAPIDPDAEEEEEEEEERDGGVFAVQVDGAAVQAVKKQCNDLDTPVLEEYDFRHDTDNPPLPINLRHNTAIRDYQEKALNQMFANG